MSRPTPRSSSTPDLKNLSLIIPCTTMSTISREAASNLCRGHRERRRHGRPSRHHGRQLPRLAGLPVHHGRPVGRPPGNIIDYTVDVTPPDDPIMQGIKSFPYTSEQYYMHVDPGERGAGHHDIQWRPCSLDQGVVMPVVWKKMYGAGRRLLFVPRPPCGRVRESEHGDHSPPRHQLGGARPVGRAASPSLRIVLGRGLMKLP